MLRFPYLPEPLTGPSPPSLKPGSTVRWRPLTPVKIIGLTGRHRFFPRALLDSGADDAVFPLDIATFVGSVLKTDTGDRLRWRGQYYPLRFGDVELELIDDTGALCRWPAVVAFSPAPIRYPILGNAGCLSFFDVLFFGEKRSVELETNRSYPVTTT